MRGSCGAAAADDVHAVAQDEIFKVTGQLLRGQFVNRAATDCHFCASERLFRGGSPACAEACPTGALKFGTRSALLAEAHERLRAHPEKYINHVYGENEAGGTSWVYLSDVPFEMIGFKKNLPQSP